MIADSVQPLAAARRRDAIRSPLLPDVLALGGGFAAALCAIVLNVIVRPRPFWVFYYDPETFYFHDGLRLLAMKPPFDVTHPGTPVQVLSALVALASGQGPESIDRFRLMACTVGWALQLAAAFLLLRTVLSTLPLPSRIAALLTFFVCSQTLAYETVWSPELLFFPVACLAVVAIWNALRSDFDARSSLLAGAAVGLSCAVKFVFLPWLFALGVTALTCGARGRRVRGAALCVVGAVAGFIAATLPAAARYPEMVGWVGRLASRSGAYGDNPRLLPGASQLAGNLTELLTAAKVWYLLLALAAVGALLAIRDAERVEERRWLRGLVLFAIVAIVLQHAMVVRTPGLRYLLPTAACGVVLVAAAAHWRPIRQSRLAGLALLALVAALAGKHVLLDTQSHRARILAAQEQRDQLTAAVARHAPRPDAVVVFGYRAPMPSTALRYFASDPRFLRAVESRYPREGHVAPRRGIVLPAGATAWDVLVVTAADRQRLGAAAAGRVAERVGEFEIVVAPTHPGERDG